MGMGKKGKIGGENKGSSTIQKSFNFKLINSLLPYKARVVEFMPNSSPDCSMCPPSLLISPAARDRHTLLFLLSSQPTGWGGSIDTLLSLIRPFL